MAPEKESGGDYTPLSTLEATTPAFDADNFEPVHYGPTWDREKDGKFKLPKKSLGQECLTWCYKYLKNPETGGPWQFTKEQARFIMWWYAVDSDGKFKYRNGTLRRMKGW